MKFEVVINWCEDLELGVNVDVSEERAYCSCFVWLGFCCFSFKFISCSDFATNTKAQLTDTMLTYCMSKTRKSEC